MKAIISLSIFLAFCTAMIYFDVNNIPVTNHAQARQLPEKIIIPCIKF